MRISLDLSNNVGVFARYKISFSSSYPHFKAEPIFHCLHLGLTSLIDENDATQVCPGYLTLSMRTGAPESKGSNTFVFEVTRFLGSCK
jgi:hypothetical protein